MAKWLGYFTDPYKHPGTAFVMMLVLIVCVVSVYFQGWANDMIWLWFMYGWCIGTNGTYAACGWQSQNERTPPCQAK